MLTLYSHLQCCTIRGLNKPVLIKKILFFIYVVVFHVLCHRNFWTWKTREFIPCMFCTKIILMTYILTDNTNKTPHKATIQENYCQSPLLSFYLVLNIKHFTVSKATKSLVYCLCSQHVPASVSSSNKRSKLRESSWGAMSWNKNSDVLNTAIITNLTLNVLQSRTKHGTRYKVLETMKV